MRRRANLTLRRQVRQIIRWQNTNFDASKERAVADEDSDHALAVGEKHKLKLVADLDSGYTSNSSWGFYRSMRDSPVTNQNEAQIFEQAKKNDASLSHVQFLDSALRDGLAGLWVYPFFLTTDEQKALQSEMSPIFRDPTATVRVKNTSTVMANTFENSSERGFSSLRHGWAARNHPSITHIGRRNMFHASERSCAARKPNFLDIDRTPAIKATGEKIWKYFNGSSVGSGGGKYTSNPEMEWHPILDKPPNLVRGSEWLEDTTGMNAHTKNPKFGNYICIVNLHSTGVLNFLHDDAWEDRGGGVFYDEETPDGRPRPTKIVLYPGSLTVLKYDARWRTPAGYTYEQQNIFRLNSWPKDYRTSLMYCHYSRSGGVPSMKPADFKTNRETTLDPAYAGRGDGGVKELQVPKG